MQVKFTENPLTSLRDTIIFDPRDWSKTPCDAWIYGIVVGWNDLEEFKEKFHWSDFHIDRLRRLRKQFIKLTPKADQ